MSSKLLVEQVGDHPAERRRLEPSLDLVDVLAVLQHADDRRVGARPADAVLFELLDERRFGETGGGCVNFCSGAAPSARAIAFGSGGSTPDTRHRRSSRRRAALVGVLSVRPGVRP
jgi:hypothetical protein